MNIILKEFVYPSLSYRDYSEWRNPRAVIDEYYLPLLNSEMSEDDRKEVIKEYKAITQKELDELQEHLRFMYYSDN
ncbi:hypothetical protein [Aquitalea pelogenes]|uniref:hypothetical protein n=1 Tax=Aquitalea pelogenes TaxID=1293573 RepID=UPI0035AF04F1